MHCRERNIAQDITYSVHDNVTICIGCRGVCSLLNVVASGHRQLWRPLVANRLHCYSGMFWSLATEIKFYTCLIKEMVIANILMNGLEL